jgi:hypothetical protein
MSNGESAPVIEPRPAAAAPPRDVSSLFRVVILVAVLASVALIWWSVFATLTPRLKESRELGSSVARMSAEVEGLDHQWSKEAVAQVTNRFSQASARLFKGRAGLEAWLANLKELAASLALDVGTDLGQPSLQTVGGRTLTVIPATISIQVQPAGPETRPPSPYQRILVFGQLLSAEKKRADLTALTVDGGTNSISRVVLDFNYWTTKEAAP